MARSVSMEHGTGDQSPILKGVDLVKARKKSVAGVVATVRRSPPNFGAPYIIDFDTEVLPGISAWACNLTEARKLAQMIGDDYDTWRGWAIVLKLTTANNPQLNKHVPSLTVDAVVDPETTAKTRKTKPANFDKSFADDDVPF